MLNQAFKKHHHHTAKDNNLCSNSETKIKQGFSFSIQIRCIAYLKHNQQKSCTNLQYTFFFSQKRKANNLGHSIPENMVNEAIMIHWNVCRNHIVEYKLQLFIHQDDNEFKHDKIKILKRNICFAIFPTNFSWIFFCFEYLE